VRNRLALLFVISSVAAGCSLLTEFDRSKLGSPSEDASTRDAHADVTTDSPTAEGGADVIATDTGTDTSTTDTGTDTGTDAQTDSPVDTGTDAQDGGQDTGVDAGQDTGTDAAQDADDGAADAAADAAPDVDAGPDAGQSAYCSQADFDGHDLTGQANVTINFPEDINPAQYSPNCIKVSVGTVVTWHGAFHYHPLVGDPVPGTPIPALTDLGPDAGIDGGPVGELPVTFPNQGAYDFHCNFHGPSIMFGSVQVVP
jgi:plastocyanin